MKATARFETTTLINVAESRLNKATWKAIGEEENLTATELKAIRTSSSYRVVAGEVMANVDYTNIDVAKTFGVEAHLASSIIGHAEAKKAEAEARKTEMEVEVETETETTKVETAPTTDELTEKLEALKAKYNKIFDTDFDKDNEATEAVA